MYGTAKTPHYKGRDATLRDFEKFTLEHGGYQVRACALCTISFTFFEKFTLEHGGYQVYAPAHHIIYVCYS